MQPGGRVRPCECPKSTHCANARDPMKACKLMDGGIHSQHKPTFVNPLHGSGPQWTRLKLPTVQGSVKTNPQLSQHAY